MRNRKSEFDWVRYFQKKLPVPKGFTGAGDDAAVIPGFGKDNLVFTTDTIVENIDFVRKDLPPEMIGRKALAINLSDIAAMGAKPAAFVSTLGIPKGLSDIWIEKFYAGMMKLAKQYKTVCVGGDITRAKEFFCSVAMLGSIPEGGAVLRSGARPGDMIGVTGTLGGSILRKHFSFEPRIPEALFLREYFRPSAMMDISDGFLQDLLHILRASGVSARVDLDRIPVAMDALTLVRGKNHFQGPHPTPLPQGERSLPSRCVEEGVSLSNQDEEFAVRHALSDGEDFELLLTLPKSEAVTLSSRWKKKFPRVTLSWVGEIQKGKPAICFNRAGSPVDFRIKKKGFSHF